MRMAKTLQVRLDKANCDYDVIPHPHSATSLESARTAGVPAERIVMRKPVATTGGSNDREARRVEVATE